MGTLLTLRGFWTPSSVLSSVLLEHLSAPCLEPKRISDVTPLMQQSQGLETAWRQELHLHPAGWL